MTLDRDAPAQPASTAARALAAAGDAESARDVGALDAAASAAQQKLGARRASLVERLVYGPMPSVDELQSGAGLGAAARGGSSPKFVDAALASLAQGTAFTADGKLSAALRQAVARERAYGFTVAAELGGLGGTYGELALAEEELAANGLGALAVEISGELTIGAGSLQGYGTDAQRRTFLPMIAEGTLMGFALTEVRIGVNAKKVRAYVELDEQRGCYRLFAHGDRNKLYITNATHGALAGLVARIGKDGKQVGLFVVELPHADVEVGNGCDHSFTCTPSGVAAFGANFNSRLHFFNFPVPRENRIPADGVEVLFYCLRMGRCMLAAMAAGYQRMFAADATLYATQREGVGGRVIRHELPRLAIGRMLGGALQSRALSHLALQQDANGVDLAGLRDITKSAASATAMESLLACERVVGGRSFDAASRITEARTNMHVFGVVEGEDDLILMGMVKDVTAAFTDRYLAALLSVIQSINTGPDGEPLPPALRLLRLDLGAALRFPERVAQAAWRMFRQRSFWALCGWVAVNAARDLAALVLRPLPASWFARYRALPPLLRGPARFAERKLRAQRWVYLGLNLYYQLELTRAQLPLQRFGKRLEHLVSMLVLSHHAARQDETQQRVAALQSEVLRAKLAGLPLLGGLRGMERTRALAAAVGKDLEAGGGSLLQGVRPQPFAHPWDKD
jgi:alkylation response protein AidB-like acyl-CoA dehydrogenase